MTNLEPRTSYNGPEELQQFPQVLFLYVGTNISESKVRRIEAKRTSTNRTNEQTTNRPTSRPKDRPPSDRQTDQPASLLSHTTGTSRLLGRDCQNNTPLTRYKSKLIAISDEGRKNMALYKSCVVCTRYTEGCRPELYIA